MSDDHRYHQGRMPGEGHGTEAGGYGPQGMPGGPGPAHGPWPHGYGPMPAGWGPCHCPCHSGPVPSFQEQHYGQPAQPWHAPCPGGGPGHAHHGHGHHGYGHHGYGQGYGQGYGFPDPPHPEMAPGPAGTGAPAGFMQGLSAYLPAQHTEQFLLGLLIGAGATWLFGDEKMRGTLMKSVLKMYGSVAGGFEELKEQMADIRAELDAERHEDE